jgi:lysophospholipase L1-like esterase
MMPRLAITLAVAGAVLGVTVATPAVASCRVVGDSVAVGLGAVLRTCAVAARIGIGSVEAASRIGKGDAWVIVAIGSNDFPRGISPAQRKQSEANVRRALSRIAAVAGARAIVVVPANGGRDTVASWLASHGLRSVSFAAGPDGIHPRSYGALAKRIRAMMAN